MSEEIQFVQGSGDNSQEEAAIEHLKQLGIDLNQDDEDPKDTESEIGEESSEDDEGDQGEQGSQGENDNQDGEDDEGEEDQEVIEDEQPKKKKKPRLQKRLKQLTDEKKQLKLENADLISQMQELTDRISKVESGVSEQKNEKRAIALDQEIDSLNSEIENDFSNSDSRNWSDFNEKIDRLRELKSQRDSLGVESEFDPDRYFKEQNPWYGDEREDPGLIRTHMASGLWESVRKGNEDLSHKDQLDKLSEEVVIRYDAHVGKVTKREKEKSLGESVTSTPPNGESVTESAPMVIDVTGREFKDVKMLFENHHEEKFNKAAESNEKLARFLRKNPDIAKLYFN